MLNIFQSMRRSISDPWHLGLKQKYKTYHLRKTCASMLFLHGHKDPFRCSKFFGNNYAFIKFKNIVIDYIPEGYLSRSRRLALLFYML